MELKGKVNAFVMACVWLPVAMACILLYLPCIAYMTVIHGLKFLAVILNAFTKLVSIKDKAKKVSMV